MQNTIKSILIVLCFSPCIIIDCCFAETANWITKSDTGRIGVSNRLDLIEIIEEMDQRSIEDNFRLIATIDSTILRCIPSINPVSPMSKPFFTSYFGKRLHPVTGKLRDHKGVDIATGLSFQYIHATAEGIVNRVAFSDLAGIYVVIDHIAGYSTIYMHLAGADVQVGEKVKIGQTIGWMGASGRVTGKHLHYEIKKRGRVINPLPYLDLYNRCMQTSFSEKER